jgi:hypothetical protein
MSDLKYMYFLNVRMYVCMCLVLWYLYELQKYYSTKEMSVSIQKGKNYKICFVKKRITCEL